MILKYFKFLIDLRFAIILLIIIAGISSLGSIIEQDENFSFYEEKYSQALYGFIDYQFILSLGLNRIYSSWWFLLLVITLALSLISCTFIRQFPLVENSKKYFFKKNLHFSNFLKKKLERKYYLLETLVINLQQSNFYLFHKKNILYAYRGLIGRISPVFVHISLLLILFGGFISAFQNFKAQEILPKGEIFRIQNVAKIGSITNLPKVTIRVNDFWIEYKAKKITQFYSNLSILNSKSKENFQYTISVNNPLHYKNIDFYQSDWNLIGLRIKKEKDLRLIEYPLFSIESTKEKRKLWITWIESKNDIFTLVFNNFSNNYFLYNQKGIFLGEKSFGEKILKNFEISEILPSTGLLIKYDPTIPIVYLGFAGLIFTSFLSYLPYIQIWIYQDDSRIHLASSTNRGKLQQEIDFENLTRLIQKFLKKQIKILNSFFTLYTFENFL